jgi:hypothetical protein
MTQEFFDVESPPAKDPLWLDIVEMILARDYATPRHRQRELGPSEVAHPCMRRLAYAMMEVKPGNPAFDPLPSIIGTATHTWLQSAAAHANMVLGRQRWLSETRVQVTPGLSGSCDLYDTDTETVIDYKVPGATRFSKYRTDPGPVYKAQVFLYGRGFENAGRAVKRVALAFLPRGGFLKSLHIWQADYDPAVADAILRRRDATIGLLGDLQIDDHPERYEWIPKDPCDCEFCPWWSPNPTSPLQCGGP